MEQNMVMFSVVIPVYNVEHYVKECLESVVHQKTKSVEIILVDDGSTDDSGKICMEYAETHSNVRYIRQRNAGLGAARNVGLGQAQGDYVIFLDSDDYWREDCMIRLQEVLLKYPYLDILYFDAEVVYESDAIPRNDAYDANAYYRKGKISEEVCKGMDFFNEIYPRHFNVSACMAAYRREFLLSHAILFPQGVLYEDCLFNLQSMIGGKAVKYLPYNLYIRRYRLGSIMTSVQNKQQRVQSIVKVFMSVMDFVESERGRCEKVISRKMRDYAFGLAHRCIQEFSCCSGLQYEIRQIKEEVCHRVYDLMEDRESLRLEEWFILILLVTYMKSDAEMEGYSEQILQKEKASSLDEIIYWYKHHYSKMVKKKLGQLPFFPSCKKIGIYGKGKHTKQLLYVLKHMGATFDGVFIIDGSAVSYEQEFEGFPVVNVQDVPKDTEFVLISSFIYEQELYDSAIKHFPRYIHVQRMYSDEMREICWEWIRDVI